MPGDFPSWLVSGIGVAAGLASMASFVPQIIKLLKERDASGVSLRMLAVTAAAFALWSAYGVMTGAWPLVGSNLVCLAMVMTIVGLRLKFGDGG